MNLLIAQLLEGKKPRGEAVKAWSALAKTSRDRKLECLYGEVRTALCPKNDVSPVGIEQKSGE